MRRTAVLLPLTFLLPVFGQQAWGPTGAMNAPHTQQPATLLPNGRVLVVGTLTCNPNCYSGYTSELYDPLSNSWTLSTSPLLPRFNHIAELLPDGKVLVAGGYFEPGIVMGNAELFDPATATWSSTGSLRVPRQFHKSAKLLDGKSIGCRRAGPALCSGELDRTVRSTNRRLGPGRRHERAPMGAYRDDARRRARVSGRRDQHEQSGYR